MSAVEIEPVLALEGVSIRRGPGLVVRDLTVTVEAGQIVGLIGPSGSGKTSLMRSIVGVQANVVGTVRVLGRPAGEASRAGQVGYVSQDPAIYGDLSVSDNVSYFARLLDVADVDALDVLDTVGLRGAASQRVEELSGGQRARLSLVIALLNDPPLLVLDEPTVGLDPVLRKELWDHFTSIASRGSTLLVSSHVMDEAARCDSLLLIRNGRILAAGRPDELLARTATSTIEDAFLALVEDGEHS